MTIGIKAYVAQAAGAVRNAANVAKSAVVETFKNISGTEATSMKGIELERTGLPTSDENAVPVLAQASAVMQAMMNDAENEAYVTEFFSKYVTSNTNVAATSFNASMALADFDDAYQAVIAS